MDVSTLTREAQRDLTASIKDAERIEGETELRRYFEGRITEAKSVVRKKGR